MAASLLWQMKSQLLVQKELGVLGEDGGPMNSAAMCPCREEDLLHPGDIRTHPRCGTGDTNFASWVVSGAPS